MTILSMIGEGGACTPEQGGNRKGSVRLQYCVCVCEGEMCRGSTPQEAQLGAPRPIHCNQGNILRLYCVCAISCEVDKSLNVAVLLSGGVDSSLALNLAVAAGHNVTAFYLQIWFQEDFRNFWDSCPWEEDLHYAQKVTTVMTSLT